MRLQYLACPEAPVCICDVRLCSESLLSPGNCPSLMSGRCTKFSDTQISFSDRRRNISLKGHLHPFAFSRTFPKLLPEVAFIQQQSYQSVPELGSSNLVNVTRSLYRLCSTRVVISTSCVIDGQHSVYQCTCACVLYIFICVLYIYIFFGKTSDEPGPSVCRCWLPAELWLPLTAQSASCQPLILAYILLCTSPNLHQQMRLQNWLAASQWANLFGNILFMCVFMWIA